MKNTQSMASALRRMEFPLVLIAILLTFLPAAAQAAAQPLASWNEPWRSKYVDFVKAATDPKSPAYVAPEDRVAAFDFDGTLIVEQPDSLEAALTNTRLMEKLEKDPSLLRLPVYKAVKTKDRAYFEELERVLEKIAEAFAGERMEDYRAYLETFYRTHKDERFGRPFKDLYYLPMLELIDFLRKNGFEVYLCSGTQTFLLKLVAPDAHVKPENSLGTSIAFDFTESGKDGRSFFTMANKVFPPSANVEFKPVKVMERTGRRPVFAFGNSLKDRFLLKSASDAPHGMASLVDHDDPREVVYRADKLLALARERGWTIVSMKNAFKRLFSFSE
jgi:phosphoserine phosphatase